MSYKANSIKTKHYILAIFAALALASCYNDDKLWDAVNEQEQRVEALESWQKVVNSNIEALQTLVTGKHYITEITPVTLEGKTVGYSTTMLPSPFITAKKEKRVNRATKVSKGNKVRQAPPPSSASRSRPMVTGTGRSTAN